ncbi:MAG: PilN domain-containing protein [Chromatiaceae bacterium]|nr:PilN domain-containing protein [Chromatiaceae bacterium]
MALIERFKAPRLSLPLPGEDPVERLRQRGKQLMRCLPAPLRALFAPPEPCLRLELQGERARLTLERGERRDDLGEFNIDLLETLPGRLAEHLRPEARHRTEIELPAEAVLSRRVSFPVQVRTNLAQVVRYEIDRLTPFSGEAVYHDIQLQPGPKRAARIGLELALCRRDRLRPWIEQLAALGSPVSRIAWAGAWPRANLLPPEERPRQRRLRWNLDASLLMLVLVLLLAAMLSPLWQKQRQIAMLDADLRQARAQALEVDSLRQELERARQGSRAAIERKLGEPRLLEILRELTERLPDDTWIQSLEYKAGEIELRGESAQATALIALLEQAPNIEGVTFRSPVTQVARSGKERFNLAFRLTPETLP